VGGQQQAPHERVDRRPADQRVAAQVPVGGGEQSQVGQDDGHHGHPVEVRGELARIQLGTLGGEARLGACDRRRLGRPVAERCPGLHTVAPLLQVLDPPRHVQVTDPAP
jgi:hypothetical protein